LLLGVVILFTLTINLLPLALKIILLGLAIIAILAYSPLGLNIILIDGNKEEIMWRDPRKRLVIKASHGLDH
jgi:hypothetical protein